MNLIRLGDRIRQKERDPEHGSLLHTADSLAQRVLNPPLARESLREYYVQSRPLVSAPELAALLPTNAPELGQFETLLTGKLLKPPQPLLCVVGPMGSGKTTTMKYVVRTLVSKRAHCGCCPQPRKRMVAWLDCNEYRHWNDIPLGEVEERVLLVLADELRSRVRMHQSVSRAEEFTSFWQYEVEQWHEGVEPSKAFRRIISRCEQRELLDFSADSKRLIGLREAVLHEVQEDRMVLLDYLIRLWRYVIRTIYCKNHGCAFIVFDNLDILAPLVQSLIVQVINDHVRLGGPTFVLIVRPETFARQGLATGVIDRVTHSGPSPEHVVLDRMERFCAAPEHYFHPEDGLTRDQLTTVTEHLRRLLGLIKADHRNPLAQFINRACGRSVRSGIVLGQGLFLMSAADMEDSDLSPHYAVRSCITGGQSQYHWQEKGVIEQLFSVSSGTQGDLLVKPRILHYLGRRGRGRSRINQIVNSLGGFGYDETDVYEALNDLMRPYCQLIRSDGFDYYQTRDEGVLREYGGHFVTLSEIGKAYITYLVFDVDYVQEAMLDAQVDGDHFPPSIEYGYLSEKFHLLYLFLREMQRIDYDQTRWFLGKWGVRSYFDIFGVHMLSLDIIQGIYPSAVRILRSAARKRETHHYEEVLTELKSLVLAAEARNNELLGIWVPSAAGDHEDAR